MVTSEVEKSDVVIAKDYENCRFDCAVYSLKSLLINDSSDS